MQNFLKGKWKHILIWTILLIYLLLAKPLYTQFFIQNGKPTGEQVNATLVKDELAFSLDKLRLNYDYGYELQDLRGYAFNRAAPDVENDTIKVVLHSSNQDLVFETTRLPRTDLSEVIESSTENLNDSGFRLLFSEDVINAGKYEIGILLENEQNATRYYQLTGNFIIKTPNTIHFKPGN